MSVIQDPLTPAALAIPKEGYFEREDGPYGPLYPKTPANYGFSILAKVKPGKEETIRAYAKTIEAAVRDTPNVLAPLKLHYLRWIMFPIGNDLYFMYQGIFDTDFDKYTEDAISIFAGIGLDTVFEHLQGFPKDWKTNPKAFIEYVRAHHRPSFMEYAEYSYVSAKEIKNALELKENFGKVLDNMQL